MGGSTPFKRCNVFQFFFYINIGCSKHQIQLFVKDLISDITEIQDVSKLSEQLIKKDIDTLSDNDGRTLFNNTNDNKKLLPNVCSVSTV